MERHVMMGPVAILSFRIEKTAPSGFHLALTSMAFRHFLTILLYREGVYRLPLPAFDKMRRGLPGQGKAECAKNKGPEGPFEELQIRLPGEIISFASEHQPQAGPCPATPPHEGYS